MPRFHLSRLPTCGAEPWSISPAINTHVSQKRKCFQPGSRPSQWRLHAAREGPGALPTPPAWPWPTFQANTKFDGKLLTKGGFLLLGCGAHRAAVCTGLREVSPGAQVSAALAASLQTAGSPKENCLRPSVSQKMWKSGRPLSGRPDGVWRWHCPHLVHHGPSFLSLPAPPSSGEHGAPDVQQQGLILRRP